MKSILFSIFSILILLTSCNKMKDTQKDQRASDKIQHKSVQPKKLLRHVVLFNFNDAATDKIINSIQTAFAELPDKIPEIYAFEWGINNSPENLNKGLTHCFLVTFLTEEARDIYLPHPNHQEFVKFIGPYIKDVAVIDYWTQQE